MEANMRTVAAFICVAAFASACPAQAEFLLNCRLMDANHPIYRHHCKAETGYLVASECLNARVCVLKKQNFKGIYSDGLGLEHDGISSATSSLLTSPGETLASSAGSTSLAGATNTLGRTTIAASTSNSGNAVGNLVGRTTGTLTGTANKAGGLLQ